MMEKSTNAKEKLTVYSPPIDKGSQLLFTPPLQDEISFRLGSPDLRELSWMEALPKFGIDPFSLKYTPMQGMGGRGSLRDYVAGTCGIPGVKEENIFITLGAQGGLSLIGNSFFAPGIRGAADDPAYFLFTTHALTKGLEVTPIPVEKDGLDVEKIPPETTFLYTIYGDHNPLGTRTSEEKLGALREKSEKHGLIPIFDTAYYSLAFDSTLPLPDFGIVLGSYSKTLAPGLRMGWLILTPQITEVHPELISGLHQASFNQLVSPPTPNQELVLRMLSHSHGQPYANHLKNLRKLHKKRKNVMIKALEESGFEYYVEPKGGYYIAVDLGVDALDLYQNTREKFKVSYFPLQLWALRPERWVNYARLYFAGLEQAVIKEGIKRLRMAVGST